MVWNQGWIEILKKILKKLKKNEKEMNFSVINHMSEAAASVQFHIIKQSKPTINKLNK